MRTRNADSSSKSTTPKKTPPARKSAGESPAAKRTPPSKTRNVKKTETSPVTDPDQSQKQKSVASATTKKRNTPGKPRTKVVAVTPNLEEQLEAEADETTVVDNYETVEKMEEVGNVKDIDVDMESEKEGEQSFVSVGLYDGREHKPMEVDEPVVEKVCEPVVEKVDEPLSFKRPGCTIVDLNISVADDEDCTGAKKGGEELKEEELNVQEVDRGKGELNAHEGEKGTDGLKEQGEKGKDELNQHKRKKEMEEFEMHGGEKGKEELKNQEGEKKMEEFKIQEGEKKMEECKIQEGEKGKEELKEQEGKKGAEELKEHKREKGKEVLKEPVGEKEKEVLKENEGEEGKEEFKEEEIENTKGEETNSIGHEEHSCVEVQAQLQKDVDRKSYGVEGTKSGELIDLGEQERVQLEEEDPEEDPEEDHQEPPEETETQDEEHMEFEAIAEQRQIRKEHEIFVGGLDRDTTDEDLRKVFQRIGEVEEVRLHKNSSTNKNKGHALVRFASKEHAKKALSEMKNPVIRGKRCGTSPSEDNATLFLGNICNTWTKEAVKQKLKDYGVEGVENITLVPDVQHEGLSQGFAFLEFSCHADAMLAYKRLQKPDVIFGHAERTAKVAFAEPIHESDPEIMAQVKSVFINDLPLHWDEDHVRERLKSYGEIVRIVLPKKMPTAKRKDYGFVDFSTHEAALACVDGLNKSELVDGTSKIKVRARLSNPLPKMQAVKDGMCGGLRIGQARSEAYPRSERGFGRGRGRQPFNNRGNFNRGRSFYHHGGRSQIGRMGFWDDPDFSMHPDFHQRQFGPQGPIRGGHYAGSRGGAPFAGPSRHYHDRAWYGIPDGGPGEPFPPRRPYAPGGQFCIPDGGPSGPIPLRRPYSPGGQFCGIPDGSPGGPIPPRRPYSPGGLFYGIPDGGFGEPIPPRRPYSPGGQFYGIPDGGPGEPIPPRRPYSPGGQFDMPFVGRHVDDPFLYDDNMRGIKRPFYMTDPEPDYMGPNRFRPRFDSADPSIFYGTRYHDYAGAGRGQYPPDFNGSDHGGGPYPSFYGGDGPCGHRYYY